MPDKKQIDFETFKGLRTGGMPCNCDMEQQQRCLHFGDIPNSCPIWNNLPDVPNTPEKVNKNDEWKIDDGPCRKCNGNNLKYRIVTSSDESHDDVNYHCNDCGADWWVDGSDY